MTSASPGLGAVRAGAAPWVEPIARAGYAAKGIVYVLVGVLAARAAFGAGGSSTGSEGALRSLRDEPFGQILLALIGAGLAAYALWRAFSAIADPEDYGTDAKGIVARIAFGIAAIVHAGLAWEALRLATGNGGGGGGGGAEHWTSRALSAPAGPWLVGAAALAIIGYAVYQFRSALRSDVADRLRMDRVDPDHRQTVVRMGRVGMAARGVVFGLIGVFLAQAALEYDPSEAGGVGEALSWLQGQSWGGVVFAVVALGLIAYGLFQLVKAKYRVISAY